MEAGRAVANLVHDVEGELRDPHGRWTRGGAVLKRMAKEATAGQSVSHDSALKSIRGIEPGKGKTVNSHWVDRPTATGYRVKLKKPGGERGRDTKVYSTPEHAAQAVMDGKHHDEDGAPSPPKAPTEETFRKTVAKPGEVVHPKSLDVKVRATVERKKLMRQQILKATTLQGQVTPDLVSKTEVTITKTPHGRSRSGTLASHTGSGNTLHIKPEVLVGDNAQSVLDHGRKSGWWVPTDKEHDLSMNVMTHEFGHGVHGMLTKQGIIQTNRHSPSATGKPEQDFWRGFAAAINREEPFSVMPPKTETDSYGRQSMNVGAWISKNKAAIKRHVSTYGGTNQNEMMAELWTEYRLSSSPRAPAKYFGDYVTKQVEEVVDD